MQLSVVESNSKAVQQGDAVTLHSKPEINTIEVKGHNVEKVTITTPSITFTSDGLCETTIEITGWLVEDGHKKQVRLRFV